MNGNNTTILLIFFFFALLATVSAQELLGHDARIDNSLFSITVTPNTKTTPIIGGSFTQTFELCNKTDSNHTVYAAYLFNYALQSGSVELWKPQEMEVKTRQFTCNNDYNYQTNVNEGLNPHQANCYYETDVNGNNTSILVWSKGFSSADVPTKTITQKYYGVKENTNTWTNVTSAFTDNYTQHNGKHIYPYTAGYNLQANSCETWKVNYTPKASDETRKWDLWLWTGANWNCILDDSCTKVLKLDPYWDTSYFNSYPLYNMVITTDVNYGQPFILTDLNTNAILSACGDLNDVRFVDTNLNVELARQLEISGSDFNAIVESQAVLSAGTYHGRIWVYSNNSICDAPTTDMNNQHYVRTLVDGFEDGDRTSNTAWDNGTVATGYARNGAYGMQVSGAATTESVGTAVDANFDDYLNFWYMANDAGACDTYVRYRDAATSSIMGIRVTSDTLTYVNGSGESYDTATYTPLDATWFRVEMSHAKNSAVGTYYIYDDTDTLQETINVSGLDTSDIVDIHLYHNALCDSQIDDVVYGGTLANIISPLVGTLVGATADTTAPTIEQFDLNVLTLGFSTANDVNVLIRCDDNATYLWYSLVVNDSNAFNERVDSNSLQEVSITTTSGANTLRFTCTDLNGNQVSDTNIVTVYAKYFALIDEETGAPFDLGQVDALVARSFDGNYVYDFKSASKDSVFFTFITDTTVRFDFNYSSTYIFREMTLSVVSDFNIPVCAAKPQTFYQSYLTSAKEKGVQLINNNVGCYSVGGLTHYAVEDAFYQPSYTIVAPYYLYVVDGNTRTLLTLIDGSNAETINLDIIEFNLTEYSIQTQTEALVFHKVDANQFYVYYSNPDKDSIETVFTLYDDSDNVLMTYTETISPNDLNFLIDFTTYGVTPTLARMTAVATTNAGVSTTYTAYFTPQAIQVSDESSVLMAIIAIIVLFFGLTLASARITFGWFGIAICVVALALLAMSTQVWWVQFLEAISVVILIFLGLIMKEENLGVQ